MKPRIVKFGDGTYAVQVKEEVFVLGYRTGEARFAYRRPPLEGYPWQVVSQTPANERYYKVDTEQEARDLLRIYNDYQDYLERATTYEPIEDE